MIDSSIIIDYLRGGKKWDEFTDFAPREAQLFLPTVVIFELFSGISTRNIRRRQEMITFIDQFQRIELTEDIARVAGELFRDAKIKMEAADCMIAASALDLGAEVVTLNTKHFAKIPGLSLYSVVE